MFQIVFDIFILIFTLLFLVGFHEFGHYIMAKFFSIPVERFVISPLGGFVKFKADFSFESAAKHKRACIILAGPLFNLLLAFFAYWIVFVVGISQPSPVAKTISGTPVNSQIIAVDNQPTATWAAVVFKILPHLGKSDVLTIQTQTVSYKIKLEHFKLDPLKPDLLSSVGIVPEKHSKLILRKFSVVSAIPQSWREVKLYLWLNAIVVQKIVTGSISVRSLVGPIGLLSGTLLAAKQGPVIYVAFLGFVSVGLAFINLLPIPGLDGAQLLYLIVELFRGKPLSTAAQVLLFRLGMILLTVLMIQAVMNDLSRLF